MIIKTLVGHEDANGKCRPTRNEAQFTGLCNCNGQHIIKWFDGPHLMVAKTGPSVVSYASLGMCVFFIALLIIKKLKPDYSIIKETGETQGIGKPSPPVDAVWS